MRNALLAAAVLVPALAWADDQPYVLRNGRAVSGAAAAPAAPAPSNQIITTVSQPTGMGANAVHAAVVAAQAAGASVSASPSGQAIVGGGSGPRRGVSRGTAVQRRGSSRRASGSGGSTDTPPPYYDKPGALIRTEGQLPVYSDPGNQRTHSVEGGGQITIDQRKAHDSGRAPGTHWGDPDKRPTTNPGTGAGGNAVTANGPATGSSSGGSGGATKAGSDNGDSGGGTHGNGGGTGDNGNGLGNGAGSGAGNNGGGNGAGGGRDNNQPSGTGFDGSF